MAEKAMENAGGKKAGKASKAEKAGKKGKKA